MIYRESLEVALTSHGSQRTLVRKVTRTNIWQLLLMSRQPFLTATSAQQAELCALTWACTLVKVKIANICTDVTCAFGVNLNFGMLCNVASSLPVEINLKIALPFGNY